MPIILIVEILFYPFKKICFLVRALDKCGSNDHR